MATLIEELPKQIERLEAKFGPDNPYVKQLKEQLRASIATQGKSSQDVYLMQATKLPRAPELPATASSEAPPVALDLTNLPFDPAKEAVRHAREIVMRARKDSGSAT